VTPLALIDGPLGAREAASLLGMSPTTFKDSGAADEVPSRQIGKGTKRKRKVYDRKDLETWDRAHRAGGNFDFHKDAGVRPTSSGSATTGNASREARASQILTRLRAKQRASTPTS
jgi:hypothetical protein